MSEGARRIRTLDRTQVVTGCRDLGRVEGSAGYRAVRAQAEGNARDEALKQAAARGATHVRWLEDYMNWGATRVIGEAYACPRG
jgi:hypothetical protein